ncbi:MAG: DUF1553 domain-containing protein [Planctomycetales bacterium]|nr:DUF1553 domain-containing protein [Planctomycetales bacterium]
MVWSSAVRTFFIAIYGCVISVAQLAAHTPPASQRFASSETVEIPDFQRHVVPLLGRLGCNGRSCHGSFQGRGDFRLSLFGYDFDMDAKALHAFGATVDGKRVDCDDPASSLVLQKPTLQIDHEGGERFKLDSWEYRMLARWIEAGAKGAAAPRELSHLEVEPPEVVFDSQATKNTVQLRVIAVWEDQHREDVTPLCRFRSNDDSIVTADQEGKLTAVGAGDTHVIAFYDNGVGSIPVMRPFDNEPVEAEIDADAMEIDRFVLEKLSKLRIAPSDLCSDVEFLRRVSIDLTGTMPTPTEIEDFVGDKSSTKRQRKIDELLERPAYAAWWTNKLCDFTGCNPNQQAELGQETSAQWYMWIYTRLLENQPYDEIVRRIVLAKGRREGQTYDQYAEEVSSYYREDEPADFATRETMPHYWTRRSMQEPKQAAEAFAHNFLGIRLQCAQCHKHPFAPWTQRDYEEFSRFFERIKFGVVPQEKERYRELAKNVGMQVRGDDGTAVRNDVLRHARKGRTIPWRELFVQTQDRSKSLNLLRSGAVSIDGEADPRTPIMDWMNEAENPWFARAFVNRVWASYFHSGIVQPPDDLNPANPPSNPKLLDWLAESFIKHDYDMKWLHREIVSSATYQRSWKPNRTNAEDRHNFSRAIPRRMPAEVVYDSVKQALAASDKAHEVRTDLTRRASGHLSMRLAGTYAMQVFGKPDRAVNCDCERDNQPTLLQSVFLQNDPLIEQRLEQSGWLEEIAELAEPDLSQLAREAWLRTVSRPPSDQELTRAVEHVEAAASVAEGMRDLMWALINTKEFILVK